MKKHEKYIDFLYWDLHKKGFITEHALMLLFKERFGRYPYYLEVCTFQMGFMDWWYRKLDEYFDNEVTK